MKEIEKDFIEFCNKRKCTDCKFEEKQYSNDCLALFSYEQGREDATKELPTSLYCDGFNDGYSKGRADAIDEVLRAMYHQCFECDNDENMQKWDSGNWFRYKLFENVIEQLKEQK